MPYRNRFSYPKGRQRHKPGDLHPWRAFFFAGHITMLGALVEAADLAVLTVTQMLPPVLALVCALLFESFPSQISRETYGSMLYIIAVCTLFCFSIQTIAQNTPRQAILYNSLPGSRFGSIFAIIFHGDVFTPTMLVWLPPNIDWNNNSRNKIRIFTRQVGSWKTLSN